MSPSATLGCSLVLLALCQSSLSWDSSNIWFPDTNNPVFYNMTFYQQAALQSVDTENLIPPTEPPRVKNSNRQRPRPAVFNPLPEPVNTRAPLRPTGTPNRNRQPSNPATNGRMQGSGISRLAAEQEAFIRNEQNHQRGRKPASVAPQAGISRLAAEQQMFLRNEQNHQRVKNVAPQSGNRRTSTEQHNMFVRNERPGFNPEVAVGYKTVPLEATTSARSQFHEDDTRGSQHLAGNRLRRTKNDNIADGGDYFGGRWSGNRDAVLRQTNNNGIGYERNFQRAVNPAERRWNSAGTVNGRDSTNRVEENVITDFERSSKATGPSKCVWAIISCCKPSSTQIRYTCFESLGCHGAFWDTNPCSKEMTQAAVQVTANFYNIPSRSED